MATISGQIYSRSNVASINQTYGPYESVEEAHETLAATGDNVVGLTVGILDPVTGKVEDYWYYGGTSMEHLVVKLRYDGAFLTVNGVSWQLDLRQPKCPKPRVEQMLNTVEMLWPDNTDTEGMTIIYTIGRYDEDSGTYAEPPTPTLSNGIRYDGPFTLVEGDNYKIKAVAVREGFTNSDVQTQVETLLQTWNEQYQMMTYQDLTDHVEYREINIPEGTEMGGTEKIRDNGTLDF